MMHLAHRLWTRRSGIACVAVGFATSASCSCEARSRDSNATSASPAPTSAPAPPTAAGDGARNEPIDTSIVALLASPERYAGTDVRVVGYLKREFEGNAVFLHREDHDEMLTANGLWLGSFDLDGGVPEGFEGYAVVEGTFAPEIRGHMGLFSGALVHIRRLSLFPGREIRRSANPPR